MIDLPFDQYQRYKTIQTLLDNVRLQGEVFRLLEVGANEHKNLGKFLPQDSIIYLDQEMPLNCKEDPEFVVGDATQMAFPDNSFDFVVSTDVFEHIPPSLRDRFIAENYRVAKNGVILCFPYRSEYVEETEERVSAVFEIMYGKPYRWLLEHRENGLPDAGELDNFLQGHHITYQCFTRDSLALWELMMSDTFFAIKSPGLLKFQMLMNHYYNQHLYACDFAAPCYRKYYYLEKERKTVLQPVLGLEAPDLQQLADIRTSFRMLFSALTTGPDDSSATRSLQLAQIFYSTDNNYDEDNSLWYDITIALHEGSMLSFNREFDARKDVHFIRLDPLNSNCVVEEMTVWVNGEISEPVMSNADYISQGQYWFMNDDPQIVFESVQAVERVNISYRVTASRLSLQDAANMFAGIRKDIEDKHDDERAVIMARDAAFQDEYRLLQDEIAALKYETSEIGRLTEERNELRAFIMARDAAFQDKSRLLQDEITVLKHEASEIGRLTEERNELRASIDIIKNSTSWKITRPIRWVIRGIRRLVKKNRTDVRYSVTGGIELHKDGVTYTSTSKDPYMIFEKRIRSSWAHVTWAGSSHPARNLRFYYDPGTGFSEDQSIRLGQISPSMVQQDVLLRLNHAIDRYRVDPGEIEGDFSLESFHIKSMYRPGVFLTCIKNRARTNQHTFFAEMLSFFHQYRAHGRSRALHAMFSATRVLSLSGPHIQEQEYSTWVAMNQPMPKALDEQRESGTEFAVQPRFSIIVPVYNTEINMLTEMIESVLRQTYGRWELCIAEGASDQEHVCRILREYEQKDSRILIKYLEKNLGISGNTNAAIQMASGEYLVLLDHDDLLAPHALYSVAQSINEIPDAEVLYSDEDKFTESNADGPIDRYMPHFKPAYNPELLRSNNYICHLLTIRKSVADKIGGFDPTFDGSQDHDFILRVTEQANCIIHIPDILYHWRSHSKSVAQSMSAKDYALAAGQKAVESHLDRIGKPGIVEADRAYLGTYRVIYNLVEKPLVSIIIPNMDHVEDLTRCLRSISASTYQNYEILIIDNNSVESGTNEFYASIHDKRIRVLTYAGAFNFSRINNFAVSHVSGKHVILLNNDTECISHDWIERMLEYSQYEDIGAVGPKLLYPDNTIQHGGVILGLGGIAGHAHLHKTDKDAGYFFRAVVAQAVSAVTGACLMVKKASYLAVGGMNEELAVAFNDIDFCLRLMKNGKRNIYTPYAALYHHESKSRGIDTDPDKIGRFLREIDLFNQTWSATPLLRDYYYNPNLSLSDPALGGYNILYDIESNKQLRSTSAGGVIVEPENHS